MAGPNDYPALDVDGVPEDFRLPVRVLQDRIEDDPDQAQRIFSILIEEPSPKETSYAAHTHKMGVQGVEAMKTFRGIILSGLLKHLTYDKTTQARLDSDPAYDALLLKRRLDGSHWGEVESNDHRVRIGATELYHFAGRIITVRGLQAKEAAEAEKLKDEAPDNVVSLRKTGS